MILAACAPLGLGGCDDSKSIGASDPAPGPDAGPPASGPDGGACVAPTIAVPIATTDAPAVIVTTAALATSFARLAAIHTVTGTPTDVVTIESICATRDCVDSDPRRDTVKAIKDYLRLRTGLLHVVLGGGIDVVPSRRVHDSYVDPLTTATQSADFVTDYYYADFSEWDGDGDGVYANVGHDWPDYLPEISVTRVPVHTAVEADRYVGKAIHHLTAFEINAIGKVLAITNVATEVAGAPIDSAVYLESPGRTLAQLPPSAMLTKLYATALEPNGILNSPDHEQDQLMAGQALVVHSGHGSPSDLTMEQDYSEAFTGARAAALTNTTLPIYLSCACQAGDFGTAGNAGEQLLNAPSGGAIAYLGNAPDGLGLLGGMQLIDGWLRFVQGKDAPLIGEAYRDAHFNLPTSDSFSILGLPVPVIDADTYRWTQKAVVLLGDGLLPVWTRARGLAPLVTVTRAPGCDGQGATLTFSLDGAVTGTLRALVDGVLYQLALGGVAQATLDLPASPTHVVVGVTSDGRLDGLTETTF